MLCGSAHLRSLEYVHAELGIQKAIGPWVLHSPNLQSSFQTASVLELWDTHMDFHCVVRVLSQTSLTHLQTSARFLTGSADLPHRGKSSCHNGLSSPYDPLLWL